MGGEVSGFRTNETLCHTSTNLDREVKEMPITEMRQVIVVVSGRIKVNGIWRKEGQKYVVEPGAPLTIEIEKNQHLDEGGVTYRVTLE